jgi:outer membrane protein assembly factor BamB
MRRNEEEPGRARRGGRVPPPRIAADPRLLRILVTALCSFAAAGVLLAWMSASPAVPLSEDVPGRDGVPASRSAAAPGGGPREIVTRLDEYAVLAEALPGEWPGFRGPDRDGFVKDSPPLSDLSGAPPRLLWTVACGEGHAGAAVSAGRVYLLDHLEREKADALRCFSLADGAELWRRSYPAALKRNHGFSRTVPAISGECVVTLGPAGVAMCVDKATGALRWITQLIEAYGGKAPPWYTGQCPLIDGGQAVFAPGGRALMIGVDVATGRVLWETANPDGWQMSHSSVMKYDLAGSSVYLYAAIGGVAAVSAAEGERGAVVWKSADWNVQVVAPSPVAMPGGEVFLTAGYGAGSMTLKVEGGAARVLSSRPPGEGMASEQQTPVLYRGLLFGVLPKDAGAVHDQFACVTPNGTVAWSSGKTDRYGLGPYLLADGKFFILSDDGTLTAVRASTDGYERLGSAPLMEGTGVDAWAPLALAGSRLLVRDSTRLFCFELAAP